MELTQISDKTNIPYAPKSKKNNRGKKRDRVVSEQAPPAASERKQINFINEEKEQKQIVKKQTQEVKPQIRQSLSLRRKKLSIPTK